MTLDIKKVKSYFDDSAETRRILPLSRNCDDLGAWIKYNKAVDLMGVAGVSKILDVGCNIGSIEVLFYQRKPEKSKTREIIGVDISSTAIERAKAHELNNCSFFLIDGIKLPFDSLTFDLVLLIEVIEHIADKEMILSEIYRILKPGGKLFLTTPNPHCIALRFELFLWNIVYRILKRMVPDKDDYVDLQELLGLLSAVGFVTDKTITCYSWPRAHINIRKWGLLPPMPPLVAYYYQLASCQWLKPIRNNQFNKRLFQTLEIVAAKPC